MKTKVLKGVLKYFVGAIDSEYWVDLLGLCVDPLRDPRTPPPTSTTSTTSTTFKGVCELLYAKFTRNSTILDIYRGLNVKANRRV